MAHARAQIRDALATLLTGLPTTGSNVYANLPREIESAQMPALFIATTSEELSDLSETVSGDVQIRELTIEITAKAEKTALSEADALVDAISVEVESTIATDADLGGLLWDDAQYLGFELETVDTLELPAASGTLTYRALYRVAVNDPETVVA